MPLDSYAQQPKKPTTTSKPDQTPKTESDTTTKEKQDVIAPKGEKQQPSNSNPKATNAKEKEAPPQNPPKQPKKKKKKKSKEAVTPTPVPNKKNVSPITPPPPAIISDEQRMNDKKYKPHFNQITQENSALLTKLLKENPDYFKKIIDEADRYRLQIIFTQIRRNAENKPFVRHHTFRLDTLEYFFPASMVKLPCAALAMEKLNELGIPNLDINTKMMVSAGNTPCHRATQRTEYSKRFGYPNLAHYIKDAMVASGNVSFDRLYEFIGQDEINRKLHEKGYTTANVTQRYGSYCTLEENKYTQEIKFYRGDSVVYKQPSQKAKEVHKQILKRMQVGKGKQLADGTISDEPFDFTYRNFVSLKDLHEMLMSIMMPMVMPKRQHFKLKKNDFQTLHKYLSMYPTESKDPVYDKSYYITTRMKYLLYGNDATPDPNIRIFNKVGMAHGFLTDCAYIVDFENKVEFFLSCTMWVSKNQVVGDNNYEYLSVGMPFMKHLGEVVLEHERKQSRKYPPDLKFYQHVYTTY
jgi:hypothetical protein